MFFLKFLIVFFLIVDFKSLIVVSIAIMLKYNPTICDIICRYELDILILVSHKCLIVMIYKTLINALLKGLYVLISYVFS